MKTVLYYDVLYWAAELAGRPRDKVPPSEFTMLMGFVGTDLMNLWNAQPWPELIPDPVQVSPVNRQFAKNEGDDNEMGDILGVYTANPLITTRFRSLEFEEGDNAVRLAEAVAPVWVEYMLPAVDLTAATPELSGFPIPRRFAAYLKLRGAGHLLRADGQTAAGDEFLGLAESALRAEINRLVPVPRRNSPKART